MFKYLGFLILTVSVAFGQSKDVSGNIIDDLGIPVDNVTVYNLSNKSSVQSDCEGNYQIKASKKDTLKFSKEGYFGNQKKVSKYRRNKIIMGFDYELFVFELERNKNMSESIRNGGQPLFIVDRKPVEKKVENLFEEDIRVVKVVKGVKIAEYYGDVYSKNGVVLIFTNCNYKSKSSQ
ncbi:hypothetical protein [Dokdonia sp. Asnod2-E02]|uniref:hypothetical protein n=1 Tax=Dokdonia sp. Asnod2-E02 TaxID=3160574 RepID=UPI003863EA70